MKNHMNHLKKLLSPAIEEVGYRPVRYKLTTGSGEKILQIMIEFKHAEEDLLCGDGGVTADDCILISRIVSEILDKEDSIVEEYRLEISSPGIDRPLESANDFIRFVGFLAKVRFFDEKESNKQLTGKIIDVINNHLIIESMNKNVELNIDNLISAKLVLNDDLLSRTRSLNIENNSYQIKGAYDEQRKV
tara:strand:+ start:876 stop:1445 length:570 start_codon:yes stop_codon:yes gene_type:complete